MTEPQPCGRGWKRQDHEPRYPRRSMRSTGFQGPNGGLSHPSERGLKRPSIPARHAPSRVLAFVRPTSNCAAILFFANTLAVSRVAAAGTAPLGTPATPIRIPNPEKQDQSPVHRPPPSAIRRSASGKELARRLPFGHALGSSVVRRTLRFSRGAQRRPLQRPVRRRLHCLLVPRCYCPAGGCQSSTLFPSGSTTHPNFPYSESSAFSRTLQPSFRSASSNAARSATR